MNYSNLEFSEILFSEVQKINPSIASLELYEFRYALENIVPKDGWNRTELMDKASIEKMVNKRAYYEAIQLRPKQDGRPVFDAEVIRLTQMLFKGLVERKYEPDWVLKHFYFDIRGFFFFHRTQYYDPTKDFTLEYPPFRTFIPKQKELNRYQSIGYRKFKEANDDIDNCFIELLQKIISQGKKPYVIGIAGQTAAGKTEIVSRIQQEFLKLNLSFSTLEIDHFLTDRDLREERGVDSLGKEALHFDLFINALKDLRTGIKVFIPQYDFISAISSHTEDGILKEGYLMGEVPPADIIFIEGNFPFLYPEVAELIDLKVVYLTDDEIRLKRKWKRDMDYRKKYDVTYFVNRYFREQYLMAESAYTPQIRQCDLLVDTTDAKVWLSPSLKKLLID